MPKVGKKHYDYTPKGIEAAKKAAKKKGLDPKMVARQAAAKDMRDGK